MDWLKHVVELSGLGVWEFDLRKGLRLGPHAGVLLGHDPDRLPSTGEGWSELLHPDDRDTILQRLRELQGEGPLELDLRLAANSGEWRWVRLSAKVVERDEGGLPLRLVGVHSDVTPQKEVEAALRGSEERYRQLIELLPHGVGVIQGGRVVFANQAAARIMGYDSSDGLLGIDPTQPVTEDDRRRVIGLARQLLDGSLQGPIHFETQLNRRDGSQVPVEGYVTAITHDGAMALQLFFMDLSPRLQAEHARVKLEQQLLEGRRLQSIGRLAGGIAHEYNNLLTPVIINTSLMLQETLAGDPRRQDFEDVLEAATRAKELTRQLLAFGRRQLLQVTAIDLNQLIHTWHDTLRHLIREDVTVDLELTPHIALVRADPTQVQQVLVNLVLNARDSMPQGGRIRIATCNATAPERTDLEPGDFVCLSVSDTGQGMDAQMVANVFDPFYSTKDPSFGAGLGLATVYGIVKQHGGDVQVQSTVGQGSTFQVYLPVAAAPHAPATPEEPERTTVLVVEDESLLRRQICRILQRLGLVVLAAEDGGQALELARQHPSPIDLLLTDVVMPNIDGPELQRRLKQLHPGIAVIFMSGYTDEVVTQQMREGLFLEKPFSLQALQEQLRQALGRDPTSGVD